MQAPVKAYAVSREVPDHDGGVNRARDQLLAVLAEKAAGDARRMALGKAELAESTRLPVDDMHLLLEVADLRFLSRSRQFTASTERPRYTPNRLVRDTPAL